MASSVKNEVHFHSTAFKCATTDGSATSDACFGEDLCRWLIRELRGRGGHNPSDKPTKGDFCWYVAFHVGGAEHRFFVRFVPQNPSAGEEWRGWLERRTGFIGSLFGRQRRAILDEAIQAVDAVLTSSPDVHAVTWHEPTHAKKIAEVKCNNCGRTVVAYRTVKGRILVTTTSGVVLAIIGGVIGAAIGMVTGGEGLPATIPLAAVGLVVGCGAGYIISDKTLDRPKCPKCKEPIKFHFK
jgi:hypothetical protein